MTAALGNPSIIWTARNWHAPPGIWIVPFYTAQLDLGNLSLSRQEVNRGVQYAFYGALDEFVLASRAMSEKEIHDFYEAGQAVVQTTPTRRCDRARQ